MKEIFANKDENAVIEIFASLSKTQYAQVQEDEVELEIPSNTEMTNKAGSRDLYFTCYGKKAAIELTDGLDSSSVQWQEVYLGDDLLSGNSKKNEET